MNISYYYNRKKGTQCIIDLLAQKYSLETCFSDNSEVILKNDDFLLHVKSKYVFLHFLSENSELITGVTRSFNL